MARNVKSTRVSRFNERDADEMRRKALLRKGEMYNVHELYRYGETERTGRRWVPLCENQGGKYMLKIGSEHSPFCVKASQQYVNACVDTFSREVIPFPVTRLRTRMVLRIK